MKSLVEINEGTVWGSVIKRSIGQQDVRKEERKSPFFGVGVDYKLYVEGEKRLFDWADVHDILKKNPGWRLPCLEDIKRICPQPKSEEHDLASLIMDVDVLVFKFEQELVGDECVIKSKFGELVMPCVGFKNDDSDRVYKYSSYFWMSDEVERHSDTHYAFRFNCNKEDHIEAKTDYGYPYLSFQVVLIKDSGAGHMNEGTVWGGAIKRSIGQQGVRKEDFNKIHTWANNIGLSGDDYEITNDGKLNILINDSEMDVVICDDDLENGVLPVKFGIVKCGLVFSMSNLKSCVGLPDEVGGDLRFAFCKELKSLEGCPKKVGRCFNIKYCTSLESLDGCPEEIGLDFYMGGNENLKSTSGFPRTVGRNFEYRKNTKLDYSKYKDRINGKIILLD